MSPIALLKRLVSCGPQAPLEGVIEPFPLLARPMNREPFRAASRQKAIRLGRHESVTPAGGRFGRAPT